MAGRRDARTQRHAEAMELAWTISALRLQGRKLQRLATLLEAPKPIRAQTGDEMLAALQSLAGQEGVDMTFRLVKTREELDAEIAAKIAAGELDEEGRPIRPPIAGLTELGGPV